MNIAGYNGTISVKEATRLAKQGIYAVNAMCVGGWEHLLHSFIKAKKNFESGRNIARNFHMELMLILSGRRQIKDALALCGVENAESIAIISEKDFFISLERNDSVMNCNPKKLEYLGIKAKITGKECDAFFENSAMVELEK